MTKPKRKTTTKTRPASRSGAPRRAAAAARPVTGSTRRQEISAELDAISYTRGRLNKQLEDLRRRQYQAVLDAREERMTWAEIGAELRLAGPTVAQLQPPRGWKPRP